MGLFKEENSVITVDPEIKLIPVYKKIFTRDRNKYKRGAERDFLFIYHMMDYRSPFSIYPESDRLNQVKVALLIDNVDYPDSLVLEGIEVYKELNYTPSIRTLSEITETLHTSNNIIKALREEIEDKLGSDDKDIDDLVSKLDSLLKIAEKVPKNIDNIERVKDKIIKEQNQGAKIKGGGKVNLFEI